MFAVDRATDSVVTAIYRMLDGWEKGLTDAVLPLQAEQQAALAAVDVLSTAWFPNGIEFIHEVVGPSDAEVLLDGRVIGNDLSGRYVTLAPGEHTWAARREGHDDATFTHTARGGDYPDVRLVLTPRPAEPSGEPCDAACREAIRAEALREGEARARARFEEKVREVRREVRQAFELIYRRRVDPSLSLIAGGALSAGLTLDVGPGFFLGGEAQ